jgi:4-amino-4-deoxy-L-arabinose transferase-like glycosyltransferase
VLCFGIFLLFGHIEKLPLRQYDEARQAINAMEMVQSGNCIVTSYDGVPETWNTKPPLLIWLQASFMTVLGPTELAVRLPSAIAGLLTGFMLWFFAKRHLSSEYLGLLAAGILFTTAGYVRLHGSRTGDFDALLTLFTTWAGLSLWLYREKKERGYFKQFFVAITFGMLTKGIAALLFTPAYLIFLISNKQLFPLLRWRITYLGLAASLLIVGGYYMFRNYLQDSYLEAVVQNELGGRFAQTTEGHGAGFRYYFEMLLVDHFFPWMWLLPAGLLLIAVSPRSTLARLWKYALLLAITHLLVISSSYTKLEWYAMPVYPWLGLITAIGLFYIGQLLHASRLFANSLSTVLIITIAAIVYYPAFNRVKSTTYHPQEQAWDESNYAICYFLRSVLEEKRELPAHKLVHWGYDAHARYYAKRCTMDGKDLSIVRKEELLSGDTVLICHPEMEVYLAEHYHCSVEPAYKNVKTYFIHGRSSNY